MIRRLRYKDDPRHVLGLIKLAESFDFKVKVLVEVGSWIGESASIFSKYVDQVVCVDPYRGTLPSSFDYTFEDVFSEFKKNVSVFDNICWIRKPSIEAAKLFPRHSLDGVYIDGSHRLKNVFNDFLNWEPAVKLDGFFCGHDWQIEGVRLAASKANFSPDVFYEDNSWLWRKDRDLF